MSDNNYSRMPDVGSDEPDVEDKHDDLIFKEPTQIETSHSPKVSESVDEKKQRLSEHLARCRVKSAEVRAAKKAEKQANKKPRGRPKKVKEPVAPTEEVVLEVIEKPLKEFKEEEPKQNSQQIDYEKLTNMLAAKMRPPTPTPTAKVTPPPPQQKLVNNQEQLGNFLTQFGNVVRQQEQKKMAEAAVLKKKTDLHKNTKKYYGKLPPTNFFEPTNDWDALFNARS